jgi:alkaline phosphatase
MTQNLFRSAGIGLLATLAASAVQATEPAVQGPEGVQHWQNAGNRFIQRGEALVNNHKRARNVILFVGDGMGISTQTAARILEGQMKGKSGEENRLAFENLPYSALSKTYSWDQQTPDSAPTMTAMVTGYKAREGMLSVDHKTARGECSASRVAAHSVQTMLEMAAANGRSTGVVSTARLTHATPAATYAHTSVRDWEADSNLPAGCGVKDIARQLIEVSPKVRESLKVAMGGGRTNFLPRTQANGRPFRDPEYGSTAGNRNDGRDLTQEWLSSRGPQAAYVWNKAQFDAIDPSSTEYLLGLYEPSHMQYEADRGSDTAGEPSLTEMTAKSIEMLRRNPNGFFLMIEAGRIDHAHHAGNAKRALLDTIELSNAVRQALAMTNDEETLIVTTADHSHVFTMAGYPHRGNPILGLVRDVPAEDGMAVALAPDLQGRPYTTLGYQNGPGYRGLATRPDLTSVDTQDVDYLQEAAVPMSSETHAGEDVGIWASGPRAYLVRGSMEQNWIFHVMREAFGF